MIVSELQRRRGRPQLSLSTSSGTWHSSGDGLKYLMYAYYMHSVPGAWVHTCALKNRQVRCGVPTQKLEGTGPSLEEVPKGHITSGG